MIPAYFFHNNKVFKAAGGKKQCFGKLSLFAFSDLKQPDKMHEDKRVCTFYVIKSMQLF